MINSEELMKGKGKMAVGKERESLDGAEALAIGALGFLAGDMERLGRFLATTGLGPENLRQAAGEPAFLASVLAYIAEDESLLLAFAADAGVRPERVAGAQRRLAGLPTHASFEP
jgi:hypothetical protein